MIKTFTHAASAAVLALGIATTGYVVGKTETPITEDSCVWVHSAYDDFTDATNDLVFDILIDRADYETVMADRVAAGLPVPPVHEYWAFRIVHDIAWDYPNLFPWIFRSDDPIGTAIWLSDFIVKLAC